MDNTDTRQEQPNATSYRQASDQVAGTAASVKDAAADTASQAKTEAASLMGQVKDKALTAVSDQKEGFADRIDDFAATVRKSGQQFAGQQDWIAGAIDRGATELGSIASSLRENDLGTIVEQVKTLARRQPALFVGACLAAGFAVARLGKLVAADVSGDDLPTLPEVGRGQR